MGVPRGSILSVTLFGLKINGIVNCIRLELSVLSILMTFLHVAGQIQQCLNNLQKWADENGFKFSKTKIVCMHFCNLRRIHNEPSLTIDNVGIPVVKEVKFLGVIFDNKLSFIPHLKNFRAKCLKALTLLRVVAHMDWGADNSILQQL
jgi:hypothetical protein